MKNDSFDSVTDATDWLSTPLPGLAAVEAALRCQVCKDFYKTPMLTTCSHTFCSLCIRRALSSDSQCPLCRAEDQEVKLRNNWSMEEAVAAFSQARSAVLEFARKPSPETVRARSPKRKADHADAADRRDEQLSSSQQRSSKRLRSSARLNKARSTETASQEAYIYVDDAEPEVVPAPMPASDPTPEPPAFDIDVERNDGLVACPICWRRMKPLQVDRHIDTSCPGEPQPQPDPKPSAQSSQRNASKQPQPKSISISSAFAPSSKPFLPAQPSKPQPPPKRLPPLNYKMLRDQQMRKELVNLGLSTVGNRPMLERRHSEWALIWNANCDSQRPRSRAELLHDLNIWERTSGAHASSTGSRFAGNNSSGSGSGSGAGAQLRDKDFDVTAWSANHDNSYRDLIASARRTRAQAQAKADEGNKEEDMEKEKEKEQAKGEIPASEEVDRPTEPPSIISDTPNIIPNANVADTIPRIEGEIVDSSPMIHIS
ncbi:hypothetical protein F4777DRAFT_495842 [Nemania sp. FL0916]|nr:hypothetical protein F4777DRAFT_495842 [Nemania sp. FL0916]